MEWHILWITVLVIIVNVYRYYHKDNDSDCSPVTATPSGSDLIEVTRMEETIGTRQLALKTIENIGSKPEFTEVGRIRFEYQGVIFLMEAVDDCMFVNLIWPWCHSFSKFDIDEFARVRQVVNEVNQRESVSVIYSIMDSDDVALHIKKHFLLVPQIPELEEYLKMILYSFFMTARALDLEIEKCRMQECEQHT